MGSRNRRLMRYKPLGSRTGRAPSVHSPEGWRRPGPQLSSRAARPADPQLKVVWRFGETIGCVLPRDRPKRGPPREIAC
jgi:hypothetical protein